MDDPRARRRFLIGAGTALASGAAAQVAQAQANPAAAHPANDSQTARSTTTPAGATAPAAAGAIATYELLSATEIAFYTAVADQMIPADELSGSGSDCGVVVFIDRQLNGAWGGGAKMYRGGPFRKAKPEYGYQLSLTPREFFAAGVAAVNRWTQATFGHPFDGLTHPQQIQALHDLEGGKAPLQGINPRQFFDALLSLVMEGFFADPMYGGNKDKVSWKMVGFPGLPAFYKDAALQFRGKKYAPAPKSIADFS